MFTLFSILFGLFPKFYMAENQPGGAGGAGGGGGGGGSGDQPPAQSAEFTALIPAEYKEKPWLKKITDLPSLFKAHDSAQAMLGSRPAGIPQDNAKPEEWDAFYKAAGRPDKPEGYTFDPPPEGLQVNEQFQGKMREVLHKAGVSAKQAKILEQGYNGLVVEMVKAAGGQAQKTQEQMDQEFDTLATETFGDKKDTVLDNSRKLLAAYVPEKFKEHVAKLGNSELIILAGVLENVRAKHISEDQFPQGGGGTGPMTAEQKREEGRKLMASEAYTDPFHKDHEATVKKVRELYGS